MSLAFAICVEGLAARAEPQIRGGEMAAQLAGGTYFLLAEKRKMEILIARLEGWDRWLFFFLPFRRVFTQHCCLQERHPLGAGGMPATRREPSSRLEGEARPWDGLCSELRAWLSTSDASQP